MMENPGRKVLQVPVDLGNDLIIRWSTSADCDQLVSFNSRIHFFVPEHEITIPAMTRDLLSGRHPAFYAANFTLVVEKITGKIVSAMALIPQTWSYGGIPFKVGRPELVGTDPEYRGRGLIREQFRVVHDFCQLNGYSVQAITGIPFFYRQFGYEMGLASEGGLVGAPSQVPKPELARRENYQIFPARIEDLDWIRECYERGSKRYLLVCTRDLEIWKYEVGGKSDTNIHKVEVSVIATPTGRPAGFFVCQKGFGPVSEKTAFWYELSPGYDWQELTPAVLRYLAVEGQKEAEEKGGACEQIGFRLGGDHPAYASAVQWLPTTVEPGVWYVRVPDLPAFLSKIASVLQERLTASDWSGFTGNLKISFYKDGIDLAIKSGTIEQVTPYSMKSWEDADAAFPYLTFLQLLFGYRTLGELRFAYADCWCRPKIQGLVETLFPKLPSAIWGIA